MLSTLPASHSRLKLFLLLAAVGLTAAFLLLLLHATRRTVEAELAVPALMLLASSRAVASIARQAPNGLAPLIAIVGCDGSGKSTLSADVKASLSASRPAETCYLGLGSGELGNRIKRWPLIGRALERRFALKAQQTRAAGKKIPGLLTALVVFGFSLLRVRRFRRAMALRRRGITVITDRYPQTEVVGFYDGPGLSAARAGGPVVAWLAARERRLYERMASFKPDLVLRLNVDLETALRRKPDDKVDLVRAKVAATPALRFGGARIVDIDARADYESVRDRAMACIDLALAGAGSSPQPSRAPQPSADWRSNASVPHDQTFLAS